MSRWWPERILIALAPHALALAQVRGALRPVVTAHRTIECDPAAGVESWRGAVAALAPLARTLLDARAAVTVVLSNHFVRYALVPADPGLESDEEERAFARFCFAKIHGERSKAWRIRLDRSNRVSARLASAVDEELLRTISGCFRPGAKARLVSVQPYLMAVGNRWRRELPAGAGSLLVVEPDRACVLRSESGRWSAVHSARGRFEDPGAWEDFLERSRHAAAVSAAPAEVLVHAPSIAARAPDPAGTRRFRPVAEPVVAGRPARSDPYLAMALCAL